MDWIRVANCSEVPTDSGLIVEIAGREIAICRQGEDYFAVDNECPHRGGPVGEGEVGDGTITCPWHGWTFSLETGRCTLNPKAALECFKVRVEDDGVWISLAADR